MNESTISIKIKENLLFLIKKHNISEAEFCRKANLPQATVNRLLKGSTDDPRASTLKAIADFFNITVDQLLTNQLIKQSTFETTRLPIYDMKQEQSLSNKLNKEVSIKWDKLLSKRNEAYLEVEPSISDTCVVFEVLGDSMWPQFIEGIFVILETNTLPQHRDFVMYILADLKQIVLRQYIEEGNDRILKPLNFAYKALPINANDIFIGKVIQAKSDFRKT